MANEIGTKDKIGKPAFDEQTLAKVLEAAYVLQEHNRAVEQGELRDLTIPAKRQTPVEPAAAPVVASSAPRPPASSPRPPVVPSKDDYTAILAQIVETQHQIQVRHLDLEAAMSLIVERVADITRGAGAAIGILEGRMLRYRAAAGLMGLPVGSEVALEKALCAASLRVGEVIRCADVNPEFLIDAHECRRRGIQSLITVPIYYHGKTGGGLEVYYPTTNAFSEPDVHTCQLMAGLVTEALARNEETAWKSSLASERAVMLAALEKLKPNLAALVDTTAAKEPAAPAAMTTSPLALPVFFCRKCRHELVGEEQFCGQCGTPRSGEYGPPSMQSKVASMLYMQEAAKKNAHPPAARSLAAADHRHSTGLPPDSEEAVFNLGELLQLPAPVDDLNPPTMEIELAADPVAPASADALPRDNLVTLPKPVSDEDEAEPADEIEPVAVPAPLAAPEESAHWSSAAAARRFLEQLAQDQRSGNIARFLAARRGDIYLVLAVILVACVIRWGIWSNHSVGANGQSNPAAATHRRPDADLPLYDRVLIKLGLAEAPDAPVNNGNPGTRVWIDLHTALYYCPGADLYGKTPKGKFATQHEAQLDQYEPAYRKACE